MRRHRSSIPSSPAGLADDIANLTLIEVRDRLKRNERVLNGGLFGPAPLAGVSGMAAGHGDKSGVVSPRNAYTAAGAGAGTAASTSAVPGPGLPLPPAFSPSPTASPGGNTGTRGPQLDQASGSNSAPLPPAFATPTASSNPQSPTHPPSAGLPIGTPGPSRSPATAIPLAHPTPSRYPGTMSTGTGTSPTATDSALEKLLIARRALLDREAQLVSAQATEGLDDLQLGETSESARRRSSAQGHGLYGQGEIKPGLATSGKRMVMERMMEQDKDRPKNSLILPVAQTLHLAAREFDAQTAAQLSGLMIGHTQSSSPKPRRARPPHEAVGRYPESPTSIRTPGRAAAAATVGASGAGGIGGRGAADGDEIDRAHYLARLNSFMGHRDRDSDEDDDEEGGMRRPRGVSGGFGFDDEEEDDDDILEGSLGALSPVQYMQDGRARSSSSRGRHGAGAMADGIFDIDDDDDDHEHGADDGQLGYAGDNDRLDLGLSRDRMEPGTGEEVDSDGEDDERFKEGNDDYTLGHGDGDEYMDR